MATIKAITETAAQATRTDSLFPPAAIVRLPSSVMRILAQTTTNETAMAEGHSAIRIQFRIGINAMTPRIHGKFHVRRATTATATPTTIRHRHRGEPIIQLQSSARRIHA